jgi:TolB-like protein
VRRFLVVVLFACLGLPLIAATPPPFSTKPTVVVFPFTANGSQIDREASSRLATIIATRMADTGTVTVIPPPPGTERKDFLAVARGSNADYYIAGFISSLGNGVSVVEQVVSAATGIVVFSNTAQLSTYAEAAGQGDDLALFIARHANRAYSSIGTPPPAASPTPQPAKEAQTNLGKLFGRKKKTAAAPANPSAAPTAAATAPAAALINVTPTPKPIAAQTAATAPPSPAAASTVSASGRAMVPVGGAADAALRDIATSRVAERTHAEQVASSAIACVDHPRDAVLSGTLSTRGAANGNVGATFDLTAADCAGKVIWHGSYSNDAAGPQASQVAVERAVDAAVGAYLNPPRRGAHR